MFLLEYSIEAKLKMKVKRSGCVNTLSWFIIVFTPKYRRKIEFNQYKWDIVDIIKRLCKYKGVEIIEGPIMPDYINLLYLKDK